MTQRTIGILFLMVVLSPACGDPGAEPFDGSTQEETELETEHSSEVETVPAALTGRLAGPVSGVRYETPSARGVTDENGTFRYNDGEIVRFSVGDTFLGETPGKPEVSPFDLASMAPLVSNRAIRRAVSDATHPFQIAINLAVFLQTLDHDGKPENGIEITAEVAELFHAARISFDQAWDRFEHDPGFRTGLNTANEQGLLSEHRAVRHPALAMRALYRTIGIEPQLFVMVENVQTNTSGSTYIHTIEYDAGARRVWEQSVHVGGREPVVATFEYDDEGREITYERTDGGEVTQVRTSTYDLNGNKTRVQTVDRFGDGATLQVSFAYDPFGNQIQVRRDGDADGAPDSTSATEWNEDGTKARDLRDDDADGNVDLVCDYVYENDGQTVRIEKDVSHDGTIDETVVLTYDPDGRLIRTTREDAQGIPFEIDQYLYDANGNLIRRERTDENRHSVVRRTYDDAGDLILVESNTRQEGFKVARVSEYDAVGNEIQRTSDFGADADVDRVTEYTYEPTTGWVYVFAAGRATSDVFCDAPIL